VTNNAFFGLDADDSGLDEVVHDAASWIYLDDELPVVAHHLRSDDVVGRRACSASHALHPACFTRAARHVLSRVIIHEPGAVVQEVPSR